MDSNLPLFSPFFIFTGKKKQKSVSFNANNAMACLSHGFSEKKGLNTLWEQ